MASRSNASSPGRSGGSAAPGTASGDASPDARPTASAVVGVPAFQWLGRGKRRGGVTEYRGFRADTHFVALGDVVMLDPGPGESEPFVGWVTRLFEASDGQMMMRAQWFFRKQDCYEWLAPPGKRPEANSPAGRILAAALDNELFASNQVRTTDHIRFRIVAFFFSLSLSPSRTRAPSRAGSSPSRNETSPLSDPRPTRLA